MPAQLPETPNRTHILVLIVLSQFACTSLWFAVNAVMPDISIAFHVEPAYLGHITSAVQFGFIAGTLVFSIFAVADRFSPSRVFFLAAVAASITNLAITGEGTQLSGLLLYRFLTGFFLAGIYPVGMKIAADHFREGLGKSLGFLVGALVLGTAFPHLLKSFMMHFNWRYTMLATSALALCGGLMVVLFIPDGPGRAKPQKVRLASFLRGFRSLAFRQAALGYFGHMWEVYAFWAFVPSMLLYWQQQHPSVTVPVPLFSFLIIASGTPACIAGGLLSQRFGVKRMAALILLCSGCCCLLSPWALTLEPFALMVAFLFCWGLTVAADSPLFSTLVARNAPADAKGSSLTIVNCIGFAITIVSIQLIQLYINESNHYYIFLLLAIGPLLGLAGLFIPAGTNRKDRVSDLEQPTSSHL